ncbi:MAG: hypothetical protein K2G49_01575, partial [Muribaculum sp.]|nr:hypothetical protein [Muribaculum sp.]
EARPKHTQCIHSHAGDTIIPPQDDTRASFHSPLHCLCVVMSRKSVLQLRGESQAIVVFIAVAGRVASGFR